MRLLGPIVLATAAVLSLAACGSDGGGADPTTTGPVTPTSTVQAFMQKAGIAVDETDAGCLARSLDPATLDALAAVNDGDDEVGDEPYLDLYDALVRCEPEGYVAAQAASITKATDASEDEARCVIHAANALIASDPAVLAVAAKEDATKDWPDDEKAKLREAVLRCVPADLADEIVEG